MSLENHRVLFLWNHRGARYTAQLRSKDTSSNRQLISYINFWKGFVFVNTNLKILLWVGFQLDLPRYVPRSLRRRMPRIRCLGDLSQNLEGIWLTPGEKEYVIWISRIQGDNLRSCEVPELGRRYSYFYLFVQRWGNGTTLSSVAIFNLRPTISFLIA